MAINPFVSRSIAVPKHAVQSVLILANSEKGGGERCVAGRRVVSSPGQPIELGPWIRPLGPGREGAVPHSWAQAFQVMDLVQIPLLAPTNDFAQPENWSTVSHTSVPWIPQGSVSAGILPALIESPNDLWTEVNASGANVRGKNDRISVSSIAANPRGFSIAVVEADDVCFIFDFGKWRVAFKYRGVGYCLSLTDPLFTPAIGMSFPKKKLCVSMTPPFSSERAPTPCHYKVVATVF